MLAEKQKIVSALDSMTDNEIQGLWRFIQSRYSRRLASPTWESIPVEAPTKEEKAILDSIDEDDNNFISQSELLDRLGLTASDLHLAEVSKT